MSSPSLRPTFPPRTNPQPLAVPNALDQGIQTRNQSLLRNPSGLPPHTHTRGHRHAEGPTDAQGGHGRCSSTGINGNKTSFGWGSERKSRMAWDTGVTCSHAPLAAPGIKPRVIFPRCPAGPGAPRARFQPLYPSERL